MPEFQLIELAPLPDAAKARMSSTVQLSDDRIAYASTNDRTIDSPDQYRGIFIYNVQKNEWSPYSLEVNAMWAEEDAYPRRGHDDRKDPARIAYDSSTGMLYWSSDTHIAGVNTINNGL